MTQCNAIKSSDPVKVSIQIPEYSGSIVKVFKSASGLKEIYRQYEVDLAQWPVPYQERILESDFGDTYCITCGDATKPALVMIHGLGANAMSFVDTIEQLSKDYRLYLLDFPGGAGRSVPSVQMLKERNVAGWLTETIAQLEHRKVTLLGVSFGSWVAVEYALTRPKQLARLILCAPPALAGKAKLKFSTLVKMILLGLNKNRANMEKLCRLLSAPGNQPGQALVTWIYNGLNYTYSFKESGFTLKKSHTRAIKVPITFILGEHDILCDPISLPDHFPNAGITLIADAGHMVVIEQSRLFNRAIIAAMNS